MFNSTILDVAAGVIFSFLTVSLLTSVVVEAINSVFKLRSRSLLSGVKALMNDPGFTGLAKALYEHAAINPRGPGAAKPLARSPAYIDSLQFAGALLDLTGLSATAARPAVAPGANMVAALKAELQTVGDPQIKQLLEGIVDRSGGELKRIEANLAAWFDNGMDRVSGAFKRWTQLASFVIAFLIAALINVDAIRVATLLWEQPSLASRMQGFSQLPLTSSGKSPQSQEEATSTLETMLRSGLPVGWESEHTVEVTDGHAWLSSDWMRNTLPSRLLGWIVTALAALFGAPFWFDTLQTVVRLKGSGPKPARSRAAGG